MERYKNLGRDSGISSYEVGDDFIIVQFTDGASYLYDNYSTGSQNIEYMKSLALRGFGLNEFINKKVRKNYSRKIR